MTTPDQDILEPFAIRMENNPDDAAQHWLRVSHGRAGSNPTRAWVPEASLTLMITWRCTVPKSATINLENMAGERRRIHHFPATEAGQATVTHIVPMEGESIRVLPSTIGVGEEAELVITVIPMQFST